MRGFVNPHICTCRNVSRCLQRRERKQPTALFGRTRAGRVSLSIAIENSVKLREIFASGITNALLRPAVRLGDRGAIGAPRQRGTPQLFVGDAAIVQGHGTRRAIAWTNTRKGSTNAAKRLLRLSDVDTQRRSINHALRGFSLSVSGFSSTAMACENASIPAMCATLPIRACWPPRRKRARPVS